MRPLEALAPALALLLPALARGAGENPTPSRLVGVKTSPLSERLQDEWDELAGGNDPADFHTLCRRALDAGDDGMAAHPDGRWLRTGLYVSARLFELREDALASWRRFAGPGARGAERALPPRPPERALLAIVRRFPNTIPAFRAALRLADRRLEEGRPEDALEILEGVPAWEDAPALAARAATRTAFLRARLGLDAGRPEAADRLGKNRRDGRRLTASFARPLGRREWTSPDPPPAGPVWMAVGEQRLVLIEPHRVEAVALRESGALETRVTSRRLASSAARAFLDRDRLFVTTKTEPWPWKLPSGKREKPGNEILALDPDAGRLLWEARPPASLEVQGRTAAFVSGAVVWRGEVAVVVSRRPRGGAEETFLLRLDASGGTVLGRVRLAATARPPRETGAPSLRWTLLPRLERLFACDGRGRVLCLDDAGLRWIHDAEASSPDPFPPPWRLQRRPLAVVSGRVLAAPLVPPGLVCLRAFDGARLGTRAAPALQALVPAEPGRVWARGEGWVARVRVGDPALAFHAERTVEAGSGTAFAFGSILGLPARGRLHLVGSSPAYRKTVVVPGATAAFAVRDGILYRGRYGSASAFRLPRRRSDRVLGALPYIEKAPEAEAVVLLFPWLSSGDARLRRWAADLLRRRTGRAFDFDPDAPEAKRREALSRLRRRLSGEGR